MTGRGSGESASFAVIKHPDQKREKGLAHCLNFQVIVYEGGKVKGGGT